MKYLRLNLLIFSLGTMIFFAGCTSEPDFVGDPNPESQLIDLRLNFRVGSSADPVGKAGLAQLTLATIMHGGTKAMTLEQVEAAKYPTAANEHSFVDRDNLVIAATVHKDKFDTYFQLLYERLKYPLFAPSDFNRQKKQQLATIRSGLVEENDEWFGKEMLQWLLYPVDHPYHWPTVGRIESVTNLTLDDVTDFWLKNLGTGNLTVGIAGAYSPEQAERLRFSFSGFHFGIWKAPTLPKVDRPGQEQAVLVNKPTAAAAISMGFPLAVSPADSDYYALLLFNTYFGQHRTFVGRLMNTMRVERGLNYGDYSYINHFSQQGWSPYPRSGVIRRQQYFSIWIRPVQRQNAHFAIRQAWWELNDVYQNGMPEAAFKKTRQFLINYSKLWASSQSERLGFLIDSHLEGIPYFIDQIETRVKELSVNDVNRAIRKYLDPRQMQIAVICKAAEQLGQALQDNSSSPITYRNPVSKKILEKDKRIESLPLYIQHVTVLNYQEVFK